MEVLLLKFKKKRRYLLNPTNLFRTLNEVLIAPWEVTCILSPLSTGCLLVLSCPLPCYGSISEVAFSSSTNTKIASHTHWWLCQLWKPKQMLFFKLFPFVFFWGSQFEDDYTRDLKVIFEGQTNIYKSIRWVWLSFLPIL